MRSRLCLTAAALTAALALSGCSSSDSSDSSDASSSAPSSKATQQGADKADTGEDKADDATKDVKVTKSGVENHDVWGPNAYVVHYTITNNGDQAADYFAQFEFLDADGDVLGSTGVTADKLGPGKSKTADAAPVAEEIENGKPADIRKVRVSEVDRTPN